MCVGRSDSGKGTMDSGVRESVANRGKCQWVHMADTLNSKEHREM